MMVLIWWQVGMITASLMDEQVGRILKPNGALKKSVGLMQCSQSPSLRPADRQTECPPRRYNITQQRL